jgi:hypothetical protein
MKHLDMVDRAALWLGLVTSGYCVVYTSTHIGNSLLAVAVWFGPIIGLFCLWYVLMNLDERCSSYERLLRSRNIDPEEADDFRSRGYF